MEEQEYPIVIQFDASEPGSLVLEEKDGTKVPTDYYVMRFTLETAQGMLNSLQKAIDAYLNTKFASGNGIVWENE